MEQNALEVNSCSSIQETSRFCKLLDFSLPFSQKPAAGLHSTFRATQIQSAPSQVTCNQAMHQH